jgi:hypothetical protein
MTIKNKGVNNKAKIKGHKLDFGYANEPTLGNSGVAPFDGQLYYNTATDTLSVYNGSTWTVVSVPGTFSGTFDSVAAAGKKVTNTAGLEIEKSDNGVLLILDQNGNGGCLKLENAGTGDTVAADDGGTTWLKVGTGGAKDVEVSNTGTVTLLDDTLLRFGTGADITFKWDATDLLVEWGVADTGEIAFGKTTNGDITIYGDTNTDFMRWDTSAEMCMLDGFDLWLKDDDRLQFGDASGGDVWMRWDGVDLDILAAADDTVIKFGNGTNSFDIWFYGNAAGDTMVFDASANTLTSNGIDLRLLDADILSFGDADDLTMVWDATQFVINAAGANSAIHLGVDGAGLDFKFFGDTASAHMLWDQSADALVFAGAAYVRPKLKVTAKTEDYAVLVGDFGTIFTTRGAGGAVTFTLPAASGNSGQWVEFYCVADQNMIITGTDEELVVLNDLTADSIAFQTASEKIGGGFRAVCDGTSWIVVPLATETQTITITSA